MKALWLLIFQTIAGTVLPVCHISSSELTIHKDLSYCVFTATFDPHVHNCTVPSDGAFIKLVTRKWVFFVETTNVFANNSMFIRFTCADVMRGGHPGCIQEMDGNQLLYIKLMQNATDKGSILPILHSVSRIHNLTRPWINPQLVIYPQSTLGEYRICMYFRPCYIPLPPRVKNSSVCNITGLISWTPTDSLLMRQPLEDSFLQKDPLLNLMYYNHTALSQVCAKCTPSDEISTSYCNIPASLSYGHMPSVSISLTYVTSYLKFNEKGEVQRNNTHVQNLTLSSSGVCTQSEFVYECFWTADTIVHKNMVRQYYYFRENAPAHCYSGTKGSIIESFLLIFLDTSSPIKATNSTLESNSTKMYQVNCTNRGYYDDIFWMEYNLDPFISESGIKPVDFLQYNATFVIRATFSGPKQTSYLLLHSVPSYYIPCRLHPQISVHTGYVHFSFSRSLNIDIIYGCTSLLQLDVLHKAVLKETSARDTDDRNVSVCISLPHDSGKVDNLSATLSDIRIAFYEAYPFDKQYREHILLGDFHVAGTDVEHSTSKNEGVYFNCTNYAPGTVPQCWTFFKEFRSQVSRGTFSVVAFFNGIPYPVSILLYTDAVLFISFTVSMCLITAILGTVYTVTAARHHPEIEKTTTKTTQGEAQS